MKIKITQEIEELHQFFQDWFNGQLANAPTNFARFEQVLTADFTIITPGGQMIARPQLVAGLHAAHGRDRENPIRIWIEDVQLHHHGPDHILATYQEWQGYTPPGRGRLSTVVIHPQADAPNGLLWQHVHETWLPESD